MAPRGVYWDTGELWEVVLFHGAAGEDINEGLAGLWSGNKQNFARQVEKNILETARRRKSGVFR